MTNRYINPVPQYLDGSGDPLISGKLYVYESGTNTLKNTFADVDLSIANTNPVILGGDGRAPNIFFEGSAKVILTDGNDVQIWQRDPVSAEEIGGAFSPFVATFTYSNGSIVQASDGNYYRSIQNNNQGNDPTISPAYWEEIDFLRVWTSFVTYDEGDIVLGSDGLFYRSVQASNQGNDPTTDDGTYWGSPLGGGIPATGGAANAYKRLQINAAGDAYELINQMRNAASATASTGTHTFDATAYDRQILSITGNVTFDVAIPSAEATVFVIELYDGGSHTITYPASWRFAAATAPTLTATGYDLLALDINEDGVVTLLVLSQAVATV